MSLINTVSPKQVNAIINAIDEVTADAKVKAENAGNGFFAKWKNLWADTKSVSAAKGIGNLLELSIQELAHGANSLKDGVVNIQNFYAQKAGKPSMNAPHTSFNGAIDSGVVQDTFDGDEYGFKDASAAAALVDEVAGLVSAYTTLAQETSQKINSINAFGNSEIKAQLLSAASKVHENLIQTAQKIQREADNRIQEAASSYNIGDVGSYFSGAGMNGSNAVATGGFNSISNKVSQSIKSSGREIGGLGNQVATKVGSSSSSGLMDGAKTLVGSPTASSSSIKHFSGNTLESFGIKNK